MGSEGLEGSGGEPVRRVFGWANGREGVGGVAFADIAVREEDWGREGGLSRGRLNRVSAGGAGSDGDDPSVITPLFFFFFSSGRLDHGERQHPAGALRRVEEPRH